MAKNDERPKRKVVSSPFSAAAFGFLGHSSFDICHCHSSRCLLFSDDLKWRAIQVFRASFNNDQLRAGFIASVQFGINGARERF